MGFPISVFKYWYSYEFHVSLTGLSLVLCFKFLAHYCYRFKMLLSISLIVSPPHLVGKVCAQGLFLCVVLRTYLLVFTTFVTKLLKWK